MQRATRTGWTWFRFGCALGAVVCSLPLPIYYFYFHESWQPTVEWVDIVLWLGLAGPIGAPIAWLVLAGCWIELVRGRQSLLNVGAWLSLCGAAVVSLDVWFRVGSHWVLMCSGGDALLVANFICLWGLLLAVSLTTPGIRRFAQHA